MAKQPFQKEEHCFIDKIRQHASEDEILQLVREEVDFSKAKVVEGYVTISRKTKHHDELIDEILTQEHIEIERVPIARPVYDVPDIREEDGVLIIPVVEEAIQIVRTLVLKEEVRVRKVETNRSFKQAITLRHQEVDVDRTRINDHQ